MEAEHRWSSRKEINLEVNLYYPPIGMINGTTRNISLEGMYLSINGIDIPPQTQLEICFTAATHGKSIEHQLQASVIHGSVNGIGLMLQHLGYQEFDALRHLLNAT